MTKTATAKPTAAEKKAAKATANLKKAVEAKQKSQPWRGPEHREADEGLASHPNTDIAPSGALHAEGMRAAISRSSGNR